MKKLILFFASAFILCAASAQDLIRKRAIIKDSLQIGAYWYKTLVTDVNITGSDLKVTKAGTIYTYALPGGGGSSAWGSITGTLSSQTDLQTALDAKQATLGGTGLVKSTSGTISYITDNSGNWNTAYGWGNHASAGYLTSITPAAIGSTPNANGLSISGSTINLEPASASFGGIVTTGTQTIPGAKTLSTSLTTPLITGVSSYLDLQQASGYVGINTGSSSNNLAIPLHIGNNTRSPSSDAQVLISRLVDDNVAGNAHAFSDGSLVTRSGTIGYNSYDARISISGAANYDHYAGFQYAPSYASSGTTTNMYGLYTALTTNSGTITNNYGFYLVDATGSGTVTNNYGGYIGTITKGATNNYGLYFNNNPANGSIVSSSTTNISIMPGNRIGSGSVAAVGINTISPATMLEVFRAGDNTEIIRASQSAGSRSAGLGIDGSGTNYGAAIWNNGTKAFVIENGGFLSGATYVSGGSNAPTNGAIIEGVVGIGTTTVSAKLHVVATTEQQRTGYDASNYESKTISSTGSATYDLTGTSPTFNWNKAGTVNVSNFGVTSTNGLTLTNTQPATISLDQWSPSLILHGSAWKQNTTAASQTFDWYVTGVNTTGTSAISSRLSFDFKNNGGALTNAATLTSNGVFNAATITAPTSLTTPLFPNNAATTWTWGASMKLFQYTGSNVGGDLQLPGAQGVVANTSYKLDAYGEIAASGGLNIRQLATPSGLTATPTGTTGSTTIVYKIVAKLLNGQTTDAGSVTTTTANATLSNSNYVQMNGNVVPGAYQYLLYRVSTTGTSPTTLGLVATTGTATSIIGLQDKGGAGDGNTAPTVNSTSVINVKIWRPTPMTTAQRTGYTPTEGDTVWDSDLHKMYSWDGSAWQAHW